jgi:hypothetical protein
MTGIGRRRIGALAVVGLTVLTACSGSDDGEAKVPEKDATTVEAAPARQPKVAAADVDGPVTGGRHGFPQTAAVLDLTAHGYVEEEHLLHGTATSYAPEGTWGADGRWAVTPAGTAPYTTRVLVRRPSDAKRFNGTVVVEWFNVSSKVDVDVDFGYLGPDIVRDGYAWVGVSAQAVGITSDGGSQFGDAALGLKAWDPERYGTLDHPGDAYSYDIFSQAGAAVRAADGLLPTGFDVHHVIADGESQSAFRMLTYVNAVHPVADVYDGFLIHSRNGTGAPLGDGMVGGVPAPARVRTDLDARVLQFETEGDLFGLGKDPGTDFPSARQPDGAHVVTWEVAGTAHADGQYLSVLLQQGRKQFDGFLDLTGVIPVANNGQQGEVMRAALHALHAWVRDGTQPPKGTPITVAGTAVVRDDDGIARGGVRTPAVDVPIAVLSGEGAGLIGSTKPFSPEQLASRYPTHDAYVTAVRRAATGSVKAGFLLQHDADAIVAAAERSNVGQA